MTELSPKGQRQTERIVSRVERKFDKGNDLFVARGILSSAAIGFSNEEFQIIGEANRRIVELLESKGAEGAVYAVREDYGNGDQDSTDYVLVASRDGRPTKAIPATGRWFPREETSGFAEALSSRVVDRD